MFGKGQQMRQTSRIRDFMLIVTAGHQASDFHPRVREALRLAAATHPEVAWRADFDVGPSEHVEVFSAPDFAAARQVSAVLDGVPGLRTELAPLKNGW